MENQALTDDELREIYREINEQPSWRTTANKESAYADGNQLDSDLLQKQRELGIPPAVEDMISPTILAIQGYETNTRTDWRVSADGEVGGQDVADALNFRLNRAERQSKADRACSDAFRSQIVCGIGWVEVGRNPDPFGFPFRCTAVHRNEIYWDMNARESDLSDARWLIRHRYLLPENLIAVFPEHEAAIKAVGRHGADWRLEWAEHGNPDYGNGWGVSGNASLWDRFLYGADSKELCVCEVWYRRWMRIPILRLPDNRVLEYDADNPEHLALLSVGRLQTAAVSKLRRAYWLGDLCLYDGETPFPHQHFPYVRFLGFQEDLTGVPYGYVRGMKYPQDSLNSALSKLRWGMSVTRVERTKGVVEMTDEQLRRQVARPDADIVLNPVALQQGGRFEVKRDYQLSQQHYQMLADSRNAISAISGVTPSFMGRQGTATSGLQEQTQVEQGNQALMRVMDNFRSARGQVGELLLALIIEDMGEAEQTVVIEGDAVTAERTVVLNRMQRDPHTGSLYLSNDVQNTRLKVALSEVPSTTSYRGQQLNALSEVVKSLPQEYKAVMLPFMVSLMDMPFKDKIVEAVKGVQQTPTPEQIQQQIQQAVQDALAKSGSEFKQAELAMKQRLTESQIKANEAKAVQIGVQAAYAAMQGGAQIAQMPQVAPIADAVMQGAGYTKPEHGDDPDFPVPQNTGMPIPLQNLTQENSNPVYPPVPQSAGTGETGIETADTEDNLGMPAD